MRPVLKYPGSKWKQSEWIINYIPEHHTYLEPFFGSGAVLFNKPMSNIEVINDIDDDVIHFFTQLREKPDEIARAVELTPYARQEYDLSYEVDRDSSDLERVRKFLVRCWQGHGNRTNGYKVGWRNDVQGREKMYAAHNWYRLPEWIIEAADRLKQVQIESRPAIEVIERFNFEKVFIYADPPYLLSTRAGKQYKHEMTIEDHRKLLSVLKKHKGPVMISGYENELYSELLSDWDMDVIGSVAEHGGKRKEVIWANFKLNRQLLLDID